MTRPGPSGCVGCLVLVIGLLVTGRLLLTALFWGWNSVGDEDSGSGMPLLLAVAACVALVATCALTGRLWGASWSAGGWLGALMVVTAIFLLLAMM